MMNRRTIVVLAGCACLFVFSFLAVTIWVVKEVRQHFQTKEQFWRTAVDNKPNDPKAHWFLGAAFEERGDMDNAEREFRTTIRISPNFAAAHYELGKILYARGNRTEARAEW